ncbi:MAG TPA: cation diffusion facilitator family transporter [Bryobacteraceae bacterium]|nr:cation diffusion facilitator family transporter [Bryobacteraceae bacterium]
MCAAEILPRHSEEPKTAGWRSGPENAAALSLLGQRVAIASIAISALLAVAKIIVGLWANSTSVVSDGIESAGDVFASGIVLLGLRVAARPPDAEHPYGHGRSETLAGLAVGLLLAVVGGAICVGSLMRAHAAEHAPAWYAIWPLIASIAVKLALYLAKSHYGRKMRSAALLADASNDAVDILSGVVALTAVWLTLHNPRGLLAADHYGGFAVGLIVIFLGLRVVHDTVLQLMDTMPEPAMMGQIRGIALSVPGALAIEKCYARKTGLQYHVDLHLEVDPELTVRQSHDIATQVRIKIKENLEWVADVLVHVEPHGAVNSP